MGEGAGPPKGGGAYLKHRKGVAALGLEERRIKPGEMGQVWGNGGRMYLSQRDDFAYIISLTYNFNKIQVGSVLWN